MPDDLSLSTALRLAVERPTVHGLLQLSREPGWSPSDMEKLVSHWVGRGWSNAEILATAEHFAAALGIPPDEARRDLAEMITDARARWGIPDKDHAVGAATPAVPFEGEPADLWNTLQPIAFPLDVLPPILAAFAESKATAVGCDPASVAMAALSALSAALDGRSRIHLTQHTRWTEPPALWVVLVGLSSTKKTPPLRAAWDPLTSRQQRNLARHAETMKVWEAQPKEQRGDKPRGPTRYVSQNFSYEAILGILSEQDRGLGLFTDELAGFIGGMDKYNSGKGGAADRSFYLNAFGGGLYTSDRKGSGTAHANNLLVTICGGIQPDRLTAFGDLTDDGLWQRFIPVIMGPARLSRDVPSGTAEDDYDDLVERVTRLPALQCWLTQEARTERESVEHHLFELQKHDLLGAAFTSFVGKLPGIWGRLAMVLHAADDTATPERIELRHARAASRLVLDYIIPSASRVYMAMGAPNRRGEPVKDIAGFILAKRLDRVRASDLTAGVRACRDNSLAEIQRAVSPLIAGGWLSPERDHPANNAWLVNPRVHERFAERAEQEAERRALVRELIAEAGGERRRA